MADKKERKQRDRTGRVRKIRLWLYRDLILYCERIIEIINSGIIPLEIGLDNFEQTDDLILWKLRQQIKSNRHLIYLYRQQGQDVGDDEKREMIGSLIRSINSLSIALTDCAIKNDFHGAIEIIKSAMDI